VRVLSQLLCRVACTQCIDAIHCYRCSVVCVCLCVFWSQIWAVQNSWTDQRAVWTRVGLRNHVLFGEPDSPRGRGNLWGGASLVQYEVRGVSGVTQSHLVVGRWQQRYGLLLSVLQHLLVFIIKPSSNRLQEKWKKERTINLAITNRSLVSGSSQMLSGTKNRIWKRLQQVNDWKSLN